MKKILLTYLLLIATMAQAQTPRFVSVSHGKPCTDSLSLNTGSTADDIKLTLDFNQEKSELKVTMESAQILHIFHRDVRYKDVVGNRWFLLTRMLNPYKLGYNVETSQGAKYHLSKRIKHQLAPRSERRRHVFTKGIEGTGMKAVPSGKIKMVNDRIEQTFCVDTATNIVTLTLREVMTMEHDASHPKEMEFYLIDNLKDFNLQYQIVIDRNPCLGTDSLYQKAVQMRQSIAKDVTALTEAYPKGEAGSLELLNTFHETRNELLKQYSRIETQTKCGDLRQEWDCYNAYVDTLVSMTCTLSADLQRQMAETERVATLCDNLRMVDSDMLYLKARRMDTLVYQWITTKTGRERSIIVQQCNKLIDEVDAECKGKMAVTTEQKHAVATMKKAINYYLQTCK